MTSITKTESRRSDLEGEGRNTGTNKKLTNKPREKHKEKLKMK
jgi:hypothetical protein